MARLTEARNTIARYEPLLPRGFVSRIQFSTVGMEQADPTGFGVALINRFAALRRRAGKMPALQPAASPPPQRILAESEELGSQERAWNGEKGHGEKGGKSGKRGQAQLNSSTPAGLN